MCGIAGIIGRLDETNRAALERMNDAMVHRGPDASGTWTSHAGRPRLGRAAGAPPARDPRPLARRRAADGRSGHRARHHLQRRDLQLSRPAPAPGGRGTGVPVHRRHRGHAARAWPARAGRRELAARHVRLRVLGPASSAGCCWRGIRWASSRSIWRDRRIRTRAGRWPSPPSCARCWPPGCWARRVSIRRPSRAACGTASWSGPTTAVKGVELLWPGQLVEFDGAGNELRQRGLLAHPRPRSRSDHGRGRTGRRPGGGAAAPSRQRRAARRLPLRRRRLLGDGQSGAARRAKPDPHLHARLRGAGAQRGADRAGGSPPPSAPSITRWC